MIKQTHQEFVDELTAAIAQNREEFFRREIKMDDKDMGIFIDSFVRYLNAHIDDEFCVNFFRRFEGHLGDMAAESSFIQAQSPFKMIFTYKDKTMSVVSLGPDIYKNVYAHLWNHTKRWADGFIVPTYVIDGFLEGKSEARDYLLGYLNFMAHRNWTIIWAKTDWIKAVFPKAYEKMMKDGEFMSVEELWARAQEDQPTP